MMNLSAVRWFPKRNCSELSHNMTVAILSWKAIERLAFAGYGSDHKAGAAASLVSYCPETEK